MTVDRRTFLAALAATGLTVGRVSAMPTIVTPLPSLRPKSSGRRVVIVGGGWGGLAAARHLRDRAPDLEVVVIERNASFWSGPLSNRWLAGLVDTRYIVHERTPAARAHGYDLIEAEVTAVDRDRRRVVTSVGTLDYDWLVLGVGIREDFRAWFGDDRRVADLVRTRYPSAWIPGETLAVVKRKLDSFTGGDLLMTLPPMPYRCPPAPYERAAMIGWLLKSRGIKGKLILLDPNPIAPAFRRVFEDRYRDQITYVSDARVQTVDAHARRVVTEFDEFRFDDAILMPPQQAGDLVWQAGLVGRDRDGRPTGWADQDLLHLHARADERIFLVGDALGAVSPLFGHYPKSGHMASRHGRIVAAEIAARAAGIEPPLQLPESVCHVLSDYEPMKRVRIDSRYRIRGDGLIEQTTRQFHDANPRDEDLEWAITSFEEFLAFRR